MARSAIPSDGARLWVFDGDVPSIQFSQPILGAKFRTTDVVELASARDLVNEAPTSTRPESFDRVESSAELQDSSSIGVGFTRQQFSFVDYD